MEQSSVHSWCGCSIRSDRSSFLQFRSRCLTLSSPPHSKNALPAVCGNEVNGILGNNPVVCESIPWNSSGGQAEGSDFQALSFFFLIATERCFQLNAFVHQPAEIHKTYSTSTVVRLQPHAFVFLTYSCSLRKNFYELHAFEISLFQRCDRRKIQYAAAFEIYKRDFEIC